MKTITKEAYLIQQTVRLEPEAARLGMEIIVHITQDVYDYFKSERMKVVNNDHEPEYLLFRGHKIVLDTFNGIELLEVLK